MIALQVPPLPNWTYGLVSGSGWYEYQMDAGVMPSHDSGGPAWPVAQS
jgi:hypothetical protein